MAVVTNMSYESLVVLVSTLGIALRASELSISISLISLQSVPTLAPQLTLHLNIQLEIIHFSSLLSILSQPSYLHCLSLLVLELSLQLTVD